MNLYAEIDALRPDMRARSWEKVEAEAGRRCLFVDPSAFREIAALDLSVYQTQLSRGLRQAFESAVSADAKAIYWEFDLDNNWESAFFVCPDYRPEKERVDEWAGEYEEDRVIVGPAQSALASMFDPEFNRTERAVGRNLFLIARTVAALGRCLETWPSGIALCAGFHDQDLVFRIIEP